MVKSHKVCRECHIEKPIQEFYLNTHAGSKKGRSWNPRCKPCARKLQRDKYKKNPDIKKNFHLKYLYGISLDIYNRKLAEQNYSCAICKSPKSNGRGVYFHVDHNHKTNQNRGLLCHHCNFLIGYSREDTGILKATIEYLDAWEEKPLQL